LGTKFRQKQIIISSRRYLMINFSQDEKKRNADMGDALKGTET
jgi:hypothetical protein